MVASDEAIDGLAARSAVPVWIPYPPPGGWLVTGLRWAGTDRSGPVATLVACSGPHPLPHPTRGGGVAERTADLFLIAEEPGVGLGAHLAGIARVDPGGLIGDGAPALKIRVDRHDVPLWWIASEHGTVLVGEAEGVWIWLQIWPDDAAAVLVENFRLHDARARRRDLMLGYGAMCPRLLDGAPPGP